MCGALRSMLTAFILILFTCVLSSAGSEVLFRVDPDWLVTAAELHSDVKLSLTSISRLHNRFDQSASFF